MRFVHSGDLHFGAGRNFIPNYLARQVAAFRGIYRVAEEHNVDCVVLAGDIFDNKDVRPQERDRFLRELLRVDRAGFSTLIVDGNHDSYAHGYSNIHFLRVLYEHKRFKSTIIAERKPHRVGFAGQSFLLYPWGDSCDDLVALTRRRPDSVVVLHAALKGALADNGYQLPTGVKLDPKIQARYIALGDLHLLQQPVRSRPNMWYCGSPLQHDFGESLPKGCLVVDTDNPTKPKFVPLDIRPRLITVKSLREHDTHDQGDLFRLITDHVIERGADFPTNIVKVDYRFDAAAVKKLRKKAQHQAQDVKLSPLYGLEEVLRSVAGLRGRPLKLALRRGRNYYNTFVRAGE